MRHILLAAAVLAVSPASAGQMLVPTARGPMYAPAYRASARGNSSREGASSPHRSKQSRVIEMLRRGQGSTIATMRSIRQSVCRIGRRRSSRRGRPTVLGRRRGTGPEGAEECAAGR
jgi:hypothetical protein